MKRILKKIGIFILILILIAGGVIYFYRAEFLKQYTPTVEQIGDIDIIVKNDTAYVNLQLTIKNKSFIEIAADSIKYNVSLFNKEYLQSRKYIGVRLPGYGKDTVSFSLKIPYVSILKDLKIERQKGDSASYVINIVVNYATFFNKSQISVNKAARLKIPQPPEIEVVGIKYKKIRLKSILANAKIKIINYSPIKLSIKNIHYSMNISKHGTIKGNYTFPIDIKPKETTNIDLPIEILPKNILKTFFDVMRNKDNYDYILTLHAVLESSDPSKHSFHLDITKSGKMELKK